MQSCYGGDPLRAGVGVCSRGTQQCDDSGSWSACSGDVLPSPEQCNALDDDCDGATDQDFGTVLCGQGACLAMAARCVSGNLQACIPGDPNPLGETCDGTDDDCDGVIDEGCDCIDGNTQAGYGADPATLDVGVCKAGTQTCAGGEWGACAGEIVPSADACNALDDDCDGAVDQGDPGGGAACTTGNLGPCAAGTTTCQAGALACTQMVQASPESCNGVDDDCDGMVDDGSGACGGVCPLPASPGDPCDGSDGDLCIEGTWQCAGLVLECSDNTWSSSEQCSNGNDDDCDGAVDEAGCVCVGGPKCNFGEVCCVHYPEGMLLASATCTQSLALCPPSNGFLIYESTCPHPNGCCCDGQGPY